MRNIHKINY
jgi:hypothetical protein